MMKKSIYKIILFSALFTGFCSCLTDNGNYDYDYDNAASLKIDTVGVRQEFIQFLNADWSVGSHVYWEPNVEFENGDPERLEYAWIALKLTNYSYVAEQVGNTTAYPEPDTLCRTKAFDYTIDLEAGGQYRLYCLVSDPATGLSASLKISNYVVIPAPAGNYTGIYCLQEKDNNIDIDVLRTSRALILGTGYDRGIWSENNPSRPIEGTPKLMWYSSTGNWFYIATDQEMIRVAPTGMQIMDTWNDGLFWETPSVYSPEAFMTVNRCDFFINNGKLHVLNASISGDRKFPGAITGDYELFPYLSSQTIQSWGAVSGAINAYQIVYDTKAKSYKSFFNKATSLSRFNTAAEDAQFNVNAMQGTPVYINTINGGVTAAIMKRETGEYFIDVANFCNVVDNGYLAQISKPLSGCSDLDKATCFESGTGGAAIFYGAGNKVYSYSYTTGQSTSSLLWSGEAGDEVTCMRLLSTGGFPTAGRVLWIGVWNESAKEGRVIEFEIDPDSGLADSYWSEMFGIEGNPSVHTGFGKIYTMTERN